MQELFVLVWFWSFFFFLFFSWIIPGLFKSSEVCLQFKVIQWCTTWSEFSYGCGQFVTIASEIHRCKWMFALVKALTWPWGFWKAKELCYYEKEVLEKWYFGQESTLEVWTYEQNEEIRWVNREMTQWLTALGALTKGPGLVPNIHVVAHNHL